jgi:hypothetical protein
MKLIEKLKKSLWLILILLMINACQAQSCGSPEPTVSARERQKSDFNFLAKDMSYDEIVAHVGKEDRNIGSGLYILEYSLSDDSKVYLSFATLDSLYSASLISVDGQTEYIIKP